MIRSKEEIRSIANNLVNSLVAYLLFDFPSVVTAVDKLKRKVWIEHLDEAIHSVQERLIDEFGCSD